MSAWPSLICATLIGRDRHHELSGFDPRMRRVPAGNLQHDRRGNGQAVMPRVEQQPCVHEDPATADASGWEIGPAA